MKWAFSVLAINGNYSRHCTGLVEASSQYEAMGKALRIGQRVYSGYPNIDVVVEPENMVINPDSFDPTMYKPS